MFYKEFRDAKGLVERNKNNYIGRIFIPGFFPKDKVLGAIDKWYNENKSNPNLKVHTTLFGTTVIISGDSEKKLPQKELIVVSCNSNEPEPSNAPAERHETYYSFGVSVKALNPGIITKQIVEALKKVKNASFKDFGGNWIKKWGWV